MQMLPVVLKDVEYMNDLHILGPEGSSPLLDLFP